MRLQVPIANVLTVLLGCLAAVCTFAADAPPAEYSSFSPNPAQYKVSLYLPPSPAVVGRPFRCVVEVVNNSEAAIELIAQRGLARRQRRGGLSGSPLMRELRPGRNMTQLPCRSVRSRSRPGKAASSLALSKAASLAQAK